MSYQSSARLRPIRRRRRSEMQLADPGIPGAENRWYPSRGQARKSALRYAASLGPGCTVHWHQAHAPGQLSHYHVLCPAQRISGHFYHGPRVARKAPPDGRFLRRPSRADREWDDIVDTVVGVLTPKLPKDVSEGALNSAKILFMMARTYFAIYGPRVWNRLVQNALPRLKQGRITPKEALFQSARALGVQIRGKPGSSGPITRDRVRQMQLRQMQRLPSNRRKLQFRRQRF